VDVGAEGLFVGIVGDVVQAARRHPAEKTEARLLAPAGLSAGAAKPGLGDSQRLGHPRSNREQDESRYDPQDNSTHASQPSHASKQRKAMVPETDV
jgi:hypothetical protein